MPRDTTDYTLAEICDSLDEQLDAIATAADEADDLDDEAQIAQYGTRIEQRYFAFKSLEQEYGGDEAITVAEMTPQERADFGEMLAAARSQWADQHGVEPDGGDLRDIWWVAAGVIDAPWLDVDDDLQTRAAKTRSVDGPEWDVIQHLKLLVTDANTVDEGNWKSFAERREESQSTTPPT